MPSKIIFTPVDLILLLEIHSLAEVSMASTAKINALDKLKKLNLVKDSGAITEKGMVFIEKLKNTELPIRKWTYENE